MSNSKELNDERVLLKRTIAENKNIYKKVGEKNGVIETRSEILTEDDGKVRKTVLKQHFVDVTKRKFTEVESEKSIDQKKAKVSTKRESETVETVLNHLTGKNEECCLRSKRNKKNHWYSRSKSHPLTLISLHYLVVLV